jgi:hypothetical protein
MRGAGASALLDHMSWIGTAPEPSARSTSRKTRARLVPASFDRDVADLAALGGVPAEPGAVAGPGNVVHVGVGPGLVELVVDGRRDVLPGLVEDRNAVACLGVDADGVVGGAARRDAGRTVVAAQAVTGVGVLPADLDDGVPTALVLGFLVRRRPESGREAVHQDDAARQQDVDHRAVHVGAVEGAVPADSRHHRFHLVLVDRALGGVRPYLSGGADGPG